MRFPIEYFCVYVQYVTLGSGMRWSTRAMGGERGWGLCTGGSIPIY